MSTSSPASPFRVSGPSPPISTSSPSPPLAVMVHTASPDASTTSSPAIRIDDDAVIGGLEVRNIHLGGQTQN